MKFHTTPAGERLPTYRRIEIKVIVGQKTFQFHFQAGPHKGYTEAQIEHEIERTVDYIDEKFPNLEFKQVQLLPNRFNFIAIGMRGKVKDESEKTSDREMEAAIPAELVGNSREDAREHRGDREESERSGE